MDPKETKTRLKGVLEDPIKLRKSAHKTFEQFDTNSSNLLEFTELRQLVKRLATNLGLPPVDDETLRAVVDIYGESGVLNEKQFQELYADLLARIKEKYYEERPKIPRESFVTTRHLLGTDSITNHLHFQKKLGSGSFGEAHLVIQAQSGIECVCKVINKHQAKLPTKQIAAEIEILKRLDHPNIIKIFDIYEDHHNIYITMENCLGGELMSHVETMHRTHSRLTERYIATIMHDLLSAVTYIHEVKKVAHKDLKPENVLFWDKGQRDVKIIDFGVAEMFHAIDGHSDKAAGTALYMAPEVIERHFGLKCDVWSIGCILYLLLSARYPFIATTWDGMKDLILHTEPNYARDCGHVSAEALSLIKKMLRKNPDDRPSAAECLNDPWIARSRSDAEYKTLEISAAASKNLERFMRQSGLKNTIVNLMAHQLSVRGPQIRKIITDFRMLDTDHDGVLSHEELRKGLAKCGWKEADVVRLIQAMDVDGSGTVQYTEFLAACYTWRMSEINIVWSAFNKIDQGGDGKITRTEFANLFQNNNITLLDDHELDSMMRRIDKNNDGYIEWKEFLQYLREDK